MDGPLLWPVAGNCPHRALFDPPLQPMTTATPSPQPTIAVLGIGLMLPVLPGSDLAAALTGAP